MRIPCAILLALSVAAAPFDLPAQQSSSPPRAPNLQPATPGPVTPIAGAQPANVGHRSPSDGYGRPGGVSYRYDALGRIIEIVRTPAQ